ncbi:MAG: HipA N-terminal domain-containing protein [Deltaproteobacteria bacterium]|nr:HipA N-terminal domain-containing protein [Deltaproteobacteria bacterium]
MKKAKVFFVNKLAGHLTKTEQGFSFVYDPTYLQQAHALPISLSLPLQTQPFTSKDLHPFFANLIPEGWLFDLNAQALKIDMEDEFEMLLSTGKDCIGAVTVIPNDEVI